MAVQVIDKNNSHRVFEQRRDTFAYYFGKKEMISFVSGNLVRYYDFKNGRSVNIKTENGIRKKIASFKMYKDFYRKGEIVDLIIDKEDVLTVDGFKGYKVEFKEKFKDSTSIVKSYVTDDINFPNKLLLNFPGSVKGCPLYIEQYCSDRPDQKHITRFLSCNKIPKKILRKKVKPYKNY